MKRRVRCPNCNHEYYRAISLTEQCLEGSMLSDKELLFLFRPYCTIQISPNCAGRFKDINEATIDHIVPLAKGGLNRFENKQLACAPCNRLKADRHPDEMTPAEIVNLEDRA